MANQQLLDSEEKVNRREAIIQLQMEKDKVIELEKEVSRLRKQVNPSKRLVSLDLAIKLNPPVSELISLAETIYSYLYIDLTEINN